MEDWAGKLVFIDVAYLILLFFDLGNVNVMSYAHKGNGKFEVIMWVI